MPHFLDGPTIDTYDHPLFTAIGGEVVSLEGHLEKGVMVVIGEVAKARGLEVTDLVAAGPLKVHNSPEALAEVMQ